MQKPEQGPSGHKLGHDAEVRGLSAGAHKQHHIGMLQPLHNANFRLELLHSTRMTFVSDLVISDPSTILRIATSIRWFMFAVTFRLDAEIS